MMMLSFCLTVCLSMGSFALREDSPQRLTFMVGLNPENQTRDVVLGQWKDSQHIFTAQPQTYTHYTIINSGMVTIQF